MVNRTGPQLPRWLGAGIALLVACVGLFSAADAVAWQRRQSATIPAQLSPPALRPPGVTPSVERAVEKGIRFLLSTRNRDGSWGKSRWDTNTYNCAMTSFVGLVLLANGSTPTRGPHAKTLTEITDYLVASSSSSGLLTRGYEQRPMFSHALATTFLAHVYGQEGGGARRKRVKFVLERAIKLVGRAQSTYGGWAYTPNARFDEGTLTVCHLQALRSCRDAGLVVPKSIVERGVQYIRDSTNADGSVRYRPIDRRTRPGVTCAAVITLWNAGEYNTPLIRRIKANVDREVANRAAGYWWEYGHHGEFVEYFLAQSLWVQGDQRWNRYYPKTSRYLVQKQRSSGEWEGADGGDVYGTSLALLILQLPYNRLPVYQR